MFMTCVEIDRLHPSARQALADCCDMHRNVMRLFASSNDSINRNEEQVLFRVIEQQNRINLYVTSKKRPDLSKAGWLVADQCRQRNMQPLLDAFSVGQVLSFDLLAHPSRKTKVEGKNSARVFLRTPEERLLWLTRQGEKYGFRILNLQEDEPYDLYGKRATGKIVLRVVRLKGQLQITDVDAFRAAYPNGIGPEKAYGLGMLLLSRG